MITFACGKCGKTFRVPDEQAGKKGKCPQCQDIIVIPAPLVPPPASRPARVAASHFHQASVPTAIPIPPEVVHEPQPHIIDPAAQTPRTRSMPLLPIVCGSIVVLGLIAAVLVLTSKKSSKSASRTNGSAQVASDASQPASNSQAQPRVAANDTEAGTDKEVQKVQAQTAEWLTHLNALPLVRSAIDTPVPFTQHTTNAAIYDYRNLINWSKTHDPLLLALLTVTDVPAIAVAVTEPAYTKSTAVNTLEPILVACTFDSQHRPTMKRWLTIRTSTSEYPEVDYEGKVVRRTSYSHYTDIPKTALFFYDRVGNLARRVILIAGNDSYETEDSAFVYLQASAAHQVIWPQPVRSRPKRTCFSHLPNAQLVEHREGDSGRVFTRTRYSYTPGAWGTDVEALTQKYEAQTDLRWNASDPEAGFTDIRRVTTTHTIDTSGTRRQEISEWGTEGDPSRTAYVYDANNRITHITIDVPKRSPINTRERSDLFYGVAAPTAGARLTEGATEVCLDAADRIYTMRHGEIGEASSVTFKYNAANRLVGIDDTLRMTYIDDARGNWVECRIEECVDDLGRKLWKPYTELPRIRRKIEYYQGAAHGSPTKSEHNRNQSTQTMPTAQSDLPPSGQVADAYTLTPRNMASFCSIIKAAAMPGQFTPDVALTNTALHGNVFDSVVMPRAWLWKRDKSGTQRRESYSQVVAVSTHAVGISEAKRNYHVYRTPGPADGPTDIGFDIILIAPDGLTWTYRFFVSVQMSDNDVKKLVGALDADMPVRIRWSLKPRTDPVQTNELVLMGTASAWAILKPTDPAAVQVCTELRELATEYGTKAYLSGDPKP